MPTCEECGAVAEYSFLGDDGTLYKERSAILAGTEGVIVCPKCIAFVGVPFAYSPNNWRDELERVRLANQPAEPARPAVQQARRRPPMPAHRGRHRTGTRPCPARACAKRGPAVPRRPASQRRTRRRRRPRQLRCPARIGRTMRRTTPPPLPACRGSHRECRGRHR